MINVRMQTQQEVSKLSPKITVVGVGGAGGNAVNNMIGSGLEGCEFLVCNTDAQALEGSLCDATIQLGTTVTGGLGAGAKPEVGRASAEESLDDVMQYLEGSNMVFITAGMGGGTGTGGAPIIAQHCREKGILTVGVVTKPFHFEGSLRMKMAEDGISEMQDYVDTLIVIPNQNLFRIANEKTTFSQAFQMADGVLQSAVRGVTDLMVRPGLINLDFADIRSVMLEMGKAMMGTGEAEGEQRAIEAAEAAINNPLLDDVSMKGANGVIINVTGGDDMTLFEVDEACNRIRDEVDPNANIIIGSTFDSALDGMMRVSVVATGIDAAEARNKTRFTGGNGMTKAVSVQNKLERAQPVSTSSETALSESMTAVSKPVSSGGLNVAPAATSAPAEEPLFQQSAPMSQASTPQSPESLRGTVYRDSFIPPKAMTPHEAATRGMSVPAPAQPVQQQQAAPQQQMQTQTSMAIPSSPAMPQAPAESNPLLATRPMSSGMTSSEPSTAGLSLKPPVPGGRAQASQESQKRHPSLFERFTTPIRQYTENLTGEVFSSVDEREQTSAPSRAPMGMRPSQGNLAIDENAAPKTESQGENELDIPAFLRRQAS